MADKYRLPEEFFTARFLVRRIVPTDAEAIFEGWNTDPEVTKYLTWKPHVNRRRNGPLIGSQKGPASGCIGSARVGPELSI